MNANINKNSAKSKHIGSANAFSVDSQTINRLFVLKPSL